LYLKKGPNNNEADMLIERIPKNYKRIIATFKLIFSIAPPEGVPIDRRFLSILLKFQDSPQVLDFIAQNFYKAKDDSGIRAFYTLYALGYKFKENDYENYLKISGLSKFIKLNFILQKIDYCKNESCNSDINNKEMFLNYLKKEIYQSDSDKSKEIKQLYKKTFFLIKKLKKDIKKN
jgi:hypothetical protein